MKRNDLNNPNLNSPFNNQDNQENNTANLNLIKENHNPSINFANTIMSEEFKENTKLLQSSEIKNDKLDIDIIIMDGGFNPLLIKILILCCMKNFILGYYQTCLPYLLEPLQQYFQITDFWVQFTFCLGLAGMAAGSISAGYISHILKRKLSIYLCLVFIAIFHFTRSNVRNFIIFCTCSFLINYCVGIVNVIVSNIFSEYLPNKFRSFLLNSTVLFCPIGSIFFLVMCKYFYPSFEDITKYI